MDNDHCDWDRSPPMCFQFDSWWCNNNEVALENEAVSVFIKWQHSVVAPDPSAPCNYCFPLWIRIIHILVRFAGPAAAWMTTRWVRRDTTIQEWEVQNGNSFVLPWKYCWGRKVFNYWENIPGWEFCIIFGKFSFQWHEGSRLKGVVTGKLKILFSNSDHLSKLTCK